MKSIPDRSNGMSFLSARSNVRWPGALAVCGYICLCLVYFIWAWSDEISDLGGDSAMYMLIARHFSPFYPASLVLSTAVQGTVYPPLFPFLIGLLGGSMLAAHLLVAAALLASLPCLYAWLRREGLEPPASVWTVAIFALMPGTYFLALNIWTENLYLLLSLIAILAENHAGTSGNGRPTLRWIAAAAVAAATLTRAAALPLLAAFVIRLLVTRPRRWPWLVVASTAPFALWSAWGMLHRSGISGYLSQWSASYGHHPLAAMAAQMSLESRLLAFSWLQAWLGQHEAVPALSLLCLVTVVAIICLFGWLRRLTGLHFDAIYVALYALLLLVWPYPGEAGRLGYVLIPVLLVQGVLLLRFIESKLGKHVAHHLPALFLGAFTFAILPTLFLTTRRFSEPLPPGLEAGRRIAEYYQDKRPFALYYAEELTGTLKGLRDVNLVVPNSECIFATKPSLVALYADRISYIPPLSSASGEQFEHDMGKCRYAYLVSGTSTTFRQPMYPLDRLGERAQPLYVITDSDGFKFAILVEIKRQ